MPTPEYSYTYGGTSNKDRLRMLVPDRLNRKYSPPARFSDEELDGEFSNWADQALPLLLAAASLCEIRAMDATPQAISVTLATGNSISKTMPPAYWLQRAKQLRDLREQLIKEQVFEFVESVDYEVDRFGVDRSLYTGEDERGGQDISEDGWPWMR